VNDPTDIRRPPAVSALGEDGSTRPTHSANGAPPRATETNPPSPRSNPRFCRYCGTAFLPGSDTCSQCTAGPPLVDQPKLITIGRNPLIAPIVLFLLLVSTNAVVYFSEDLFILMIASSLVDATVILAAAALKWNSIRPLLTRPLHAGWLLGSALGSIGTFVVATAAVTAISYALGVEEEYLAYPILEAGYGWTTVVLLTCVFPAIFEELAFRGVIFNGLLRALTLRETILASALLFMLIHFTVLSYPHLLVIGLALGWLRARSGSLYPCMVLHFCHNAFCIMVEYIYV